MGDQDAAIPLTHFDRDEIARFIEGAETSVDPDIDHAEGS